MGFSLRFPSVWSIRNTSSVIGQLWSKKTENDSGYFDGIALQSTGTQDLRIPGLKYMYAEMAKVRKLCPKKKHQVRKRRGQYPNGSLKEMLFHASVKSSPGKIVECYSSPLFLGDQLISSRFQPSIPSSSSKTEKSSLKNISYKLSFTLQSAVKFNGTMSLFKFSSASQMRVDIADEGVYDTETAVEISGQAIRLKLNMENGFEHRHGLMVPLVHENSQSPSLLNGGGWLEVNEALKIGKEHESAQPTIEINTKGDSSQSESAIEIDIKGGDSSQFQEILLPYKENDEHSAT
ncbi:hypothetical protein Pint_04554 [Pistacia integerrima]|uniref:Uncharacterized protein n=1 Tax=Pistacia integerrima TaxID=434235 RepID=A0ACC0Z443_9ROSI|nr:hypothetical protein Pint_04554 [Pistacia integerrima]